MRRVASVVVSATIAFGLAACSSDAKPKADSTTTSASTTSTTPEKSNTTHQATTSSSTPLDTTDTTKLPPVDDETFAQITDEVTAAIDNAGHDACALRKIFDGVDEIPDSATVVQARAGMGIVKKLFNAIADAAPASQARNAKIIRDAMVAIEREAIAANYDPKVLNADSFGEKVFTQPVFTALSTFRDLTASCPGVKP